MQAENVLLILLWIFQQHRFYSIHILMLVIDCEIELHCRETDIANLAVICKLMFQFQLL